MYSPFRANTTTAIELLIMRLWYRSIAKIKQLIYRGAPETSAPRPSPITRFPKELVEIIVSHFIYDARTLLACSLTCYSWYIAVVPLLHHSLTTNDSFYTSRESIGWKQQWPRSLQKSYNLGLLPLVKRLRIRETSNPPGEFTLGRLGRSTFRYFSALKNLQELGIDNLQVPSFMPNIQQCFGHFAPTLKFLALREPKGSCRQILYFIGLFPNLQDLKLCYPFPNEEQESIADTDLVPLCVPPLQGWLTLTWFMRERLIEDMITLFGGLRFHRMELFGVKCVRLLLGACAETLETLRLYPTDPYGEDLFERRVDENELKLIIHRKQPSRALAFQSVTKQVPPDTRNYCRINCCCRSCRFWFPQDCTFHHHIPSTPRCRYHLPGS